MILEITEENFSKINPFLEEFFHIHKPNNPNALTQLKRNLKGGFEAKKISLFAIFTKNQERILAISGIDLENGFIMLWDLDEATLKDDQTLKKLFQVGIEHLKSQNFDVIRMISRTTNGPYEPLLLELGFRKYERTKMTLTRENYQIQPVPEITPNLRFQLWTEEIKEGLLPILVDSHFNFNHPDGFVFSQYIGLEGCRNYMKDMEGNKFGVFLPDHSYGCFLDNRLIGGITFLNRENQGYISEIAIDSSLKGQHLGKSILFKAIKKWFEHNPESQQIDLDVTLANKNAYNLYKTLGFQEGDHYVFYCWVGPSVQTVAY